MFNIKRYFGRRSNNETGRTDEDITRESPIIIRGDSPGTTTFNRKLVIGLSGVFIFIFAFSMFYGMSPQAPDKKKDEMALKERKVATTIQSNSQLDKLPSSYEGQNQNNPKSASLTGANGLPRSVGQDDYPTMRQPPINSNVSRSSYQTMDYNSPPPIPGYQQQDDSAANRGKSPVFTAATVASVDPAVSKEEQEVAEARKSPIRFNVK